MDEEFAHHISMRVDRLVDAGYTVEEARRIARERFGDAALYRAECVAIQRRGEWTMRWSDRVGDLVRDVGTATRSLGRQPLFVATALVTLGIGVGANTAIFSVVDALLLRPLPYPDADHLVEFGPESPESGFRLNFAYKDVALAWRDQSGIFEGIGFRQPQAFVWSRGGEPERLEGQFVTPDLMDMLGIQPLVGRSFASSDAEPGAEPVALLSEALWRRAFGADPGVLGRALSLDGRPYTVVGVMPRRFRYPLAGGRDVWIALGGDRMAELGSRDRLRMVARLGSPGDTARARSSAEAFQAGLVSSGTDPVGWTGLWMRPFGEHRANPHITKGLWLTAAGVLIILLVAGLNTANLLLIRGTVRSEEIAIRLALGGSRAHVVRQVALEGLLLAIAAGALAVAVAGVTLAVIMSMAPTEIVDWSPSAVELTGRVVAFTFSVAATVGLLFGVLPAVASVRASERSSSLLGGSRRVVGGMRVGWRGALVTAEIAMSVVLLAGAGVLVKNIRAMAASDLGWDPEGLLVLQPSLIEARYPSEAEQKAFFDEVSARIQRIPGVQGVTLASGLPPSTGILFGGDLEAEGRPIPGGQPEFVPYAQVDSSFVRVMGAELIAGRNFGVDETPEARARIIDRELAQWLFGEDAPIGRRFRIGDDGEWMTVVGVVRDLHLEGVADKDSRYEMLSPRRPTDVGAYMTLGIRVTGDTDAATRRIRDAVRATDPEQPIDVLQPIGSVLQDSLRTEAFLTRLMSAFGVIALLLTTFGMFGVVSSLVQRRTREFGVRIALGAERLDISRTVLGGGLVMAVPGVLVGIAVALLVGDVLESFLLDVSSSDPTVLAGVCLLAVITSLVAGLVPAYRATRVDPVRTLGSE